MKKLAVLCLVILILLTGCSKGSEKFTDDNLATRLLYVDAPADTLSGTRIIVDLETGVMYLFHKSGYGGGLTIMVDSEGKPLLYSETN